MPQVGSKSLMSNTLRSIEVPLFVKHKKLEWWVHVLLPTQPKSQKEQQTIRLLMFMRISTSIAG